MQTCPVFLQLLHMQSTAFGEEKFFKKMPNHPKNSSLSGEYYKQFNI